MNKKFYITAAIPYVNGLPHAGHALEFIQCDVIARSKKLLGHDVLFVSGSDENGLKIVQAAEKENLTPQQLADQNTRAYKNLVKLLKTDVDIWRRGSDKKFHWPGTEKLWRRCQKNGDIYKKMYGGNYCVGCEVFYTKKDLVDGKCPEHLKEPEWVEEENYFFRLSKYQKTIEDLITNNQLLIIPQTRRNEILSFIRSGLEDFSVSRSKERAKNWGIPVPEDNNQVVYTWFDALNVYQTAVGFGYDEKAWKKWWPADLHVIGKGISRFHAVYWIGMLLSARLPLPKSIFVHGYISSGGHKMSKSLGNVIDPFEVVKKYGTDATRYYLLREIPAYGDGDFTYRRFEELYNADLANGVGNLVARITTLAQKFFDGKIPTKTQSPFQKPHNSLIKKELQTWKDYNEALKEYRFNEALSSVWEFIQACDKYIDQEKPWELAKQKNKKKLAQVVFNLLEMLQQIAWLIWPFMPGTAKEIAERLSIKPLLVKNPNIKDTYQLITPGAKVNVGSPLFPRI